VIAVDGFPDWRPDGALPSMETGGSQWPFGEFVAAVRDRHTGELMWVRYTRDESTP
jgi:hypothetical protein